MCKSLCVCCACETLYLGLSYFQKLKQNEGYWNKKPKLNSAISNILGDLGDFSMLKELLSRLGLFQNLMVFKWLCLVLFGGKTGHCVIFVCLCTLSGQNSWVYKEGMVRRNGKASSGSLKVHHR